jgi:cytochrome bd-type quinol oxidase subunit 2
VRIDLRRLRPAELLAVPAAALLAVATFLPWFEVSGRQESAWRALTVAAVLAALTVLGALALAAATAVQRSPALPLACAVGAALLALLASVLIAVFALALPAGASGRCYGLWLALAGTLGVLGAASASLRDERPFRGVPVSR